MFLAFNNGIAATADYIELDKTNRYIKKIRNLQIVNGFSAVLKRIHFAIVSSKYTLLIFLMLSGKLSLINFA